MSFTNGQLAQKISDLIGYWTSYITEYANWLGGSATGGPGADGLYPLTDYQGNESLVKSPAKLQDDVDGQVSSASTSASNAATSETNAATSASTATTQAGLADTARIAAELAETNAETAQSAAENAETTAIAQAAAALVSANNAAADAVLTAADAIATAADRVQTGIDAAAAATFVPSLYAALADGENIEGIWQHNATLRMNNNVALVWRNAAATARTMAKLDASDNFTLGNINHPTILSGSSVTIDGFVVSAAKYANWDTAYGWGDHASGGYAPAATPTFTGILSAAQIRATEQIGTTGSGTSPATGHYVRMFVTADEGYFDSYDFTGSAFKNLNIRSLQTTFNAAVLWPGGGSANANTALQNIVEDTTPQLGGNLALNAKYISGTWHGAVGGLSLEAQLTTSEEWGAFPSQYSRFQRNTTGTAGGAPVDNYGYFTKVALRDGVGGGWGGLWVGYAADQSYVGRAATESVFATWEKLLTSATTSVMHRDASVTVTATHFYDSEPRLNNNKYLRSINAASTVNVNLIALNSSDQVKIGHAGYRNIFPERVEITAPAVGGTKGSSLLIASANAQLSMENTAGATDAKAWNWLATTNALKLRLLSDDYNTAVDFLTFTRSGLTASSLGVHASILQTPVSANISNHYDVTTNAYDVDFQYRIGGTLTAIMRWDSSINTFTWMDRNPSTVNAMILDLETGTLGVMGAVGTVSTVEIGTVGNTNGGEIIIYGTTASVQAELRCTNGNLHMDANGAQSTYLNYYGGSGGIKFGNGASATFAAVSSAGAYTGLSYGGVPEANLLDKEADETITQEWDFSSTNSTAPASGSSSIRGQRFYMDGKQTIAATDTWMRLNQLGDFTTGIFTPGLIRADGGFTLMDNVSIKMGNGTDSVLAFNGTDTIWNTAGIFKFDSPLQVNSLGIPYYVTSGYTGGKITVSASAPSTPTKGDIWFDTT